MFFASTGGIFLRIDANANLGIFDQAGTERVVIANGIISGALNKSAAISNGPITTTTSSTFVSTGTGFSITPQVSGSVLIFGLAGTGNNTASDSVSFAFFRNTTGVPAGGTGVGSDTEITAALMTNNANTAALFVTSPFFALVTGLIVGTKYYFYAAASITTGGTGTVSPTVVSTFGVEI